MDEDHRYAAAALRVGDAQTVRLHCPDSGRALRRGIACTRADERKRDDGEAEPEIRPGHRDPLGPCEPTLTSRYFRTGAAMWSAGKFEALRAQGMPAQARPCTFGRACPGD